MIKFVIWILSGNREISEKWYRLFSRERLTVKHLPNLSAITTVQQGSWGLAFVEISPEGVSKPEDLKTLLSGIKNISFIVFGRPDKVANSAISEFLENGADDFITSDIDERILISKTKAHMRRLLPSLNLARTIVTSRNGDIEIDQTKRTVRLGLKSGNEKTLENLTPKEFDIFYFLLGSEESVISRAALMEEIWQKRSGSINCETIDKHIETLRHKLGPYGKNIKTVYGAGYTYKMENTKGTGKSEQ